MKLFSKYLLFTLILLLIYSCQNEEDCYSCNESINNWAIENFDEISKMNRQDIINLTTNKQRAAFRVLSPENKKAVWKDKINFLKNSYSTKEEVELFAFVESILNKHTYEEEMSDSEYYNIEPQLFRLVEAAGWNKYKMVYAFGTLQNDKKDIDDFFESTSKQDFSHDLDCNCNWGWCPDGGDCLEEECDETDFGCGFLGLGSCDEICSGHPH